uniref:Uncharacterized protein n=1 Tax=Grammatophora oceanica TaxID=210454 RepID=A0A7S1UQS5_9STRA
MTAEGNVIVAVPPSHYMERLNTAGKPYRPRIQFDGDQGSYLASNMMQRHVISYEIDENRIGFAEALRCTAESAVTGRIGNRNVDGQEPAEEEEPTTISINTSGGSASSVGSGASSMAAVGGSAPVGNDDDIFVSDGEDPSLIIDEEKFYGGGCATATCRCFMGIGYVAIGTALAVAYRISRPKEKYLASFADPLEEAKRPMIRPSDGGMGGDMYRRRTPVTPDTEGGVFV